jgi:aspartyl-tRNA(Asn)/glutamyl-tRNA(Gln) amidotransferase subunit A
MPNDAPPSVTDSHFLSIAEAARLIERRQLSPVALTRAFLDRVAAIDPQLNAYLLVTADQALEQARTAEAEIMAGRYRGPMHGIPFALKDIYCTDGIRTTSHSRTRARYVPAFDATTVAKLQQAGAILLGKLATHEFAHGGPSFDLPWPPARNPWNRDHVTGGSSSGSAGCSTICKRYSHTPAASAISMPCRNCRSFSARNDYPFDDRCLEGGAGSSRTFTL